MGFPLGRVDIASGLAPLEIVGFWLAQSKGTQRCGQLRSPRFDHRTCIPLSLHFRRDCRPYVPELSRRQSKILLEQSCCHHFTSI